MSGNCRSKKRAFNVDKNSVGPGGAQQVVVYGFDPFLPESTLRLNFEQFGSIALVQSKTDPTTGSFLGIASIKYQRVSSKIFFDECALQTVFPDQNFCMISSGSGGLIEVRRNTRNFPGRFFWNIMMAVCSSASTIRSLMWKMSPVILRSAI